VIKKRRCKAHTTETASETPGAVCVCMCASLSCQVVDHCRSMVWH